MRKLANEKITKLMGECWHEVDGMTTAIRSNGFNKWLVMTCAHCGERVELDYEYSRQYVLFPNNDFYSASGFAKMWSWCCSQSWFKDIIFPKFWPSYTVEQIVDIVYDFLCIESLMSEESITDSRLREYADATTAASKLVTYMQKKFFPDADGFEPLDTLPGLLDQIDNMVCGIPTSESKCAKPTSGAVKIKKAGEKVEVGSRFLLDSKIYEVKSEKAPNSCIGCSFVNSIRCGENLPLCIGLVFVESVPRVEELPDGMFMRAGFRFMLDDVIYEAVDSDTRSCNECDLKRSSTCHRSPRCSSFIFKKVQL